MCAGTAIGNGTPVEVGIKRNRSIKDCVCNEIVDNIYFLHIKLLVSNMLVDYFQF